MRPSFRRLASPALHHRPPLTAPLPLKSYAPTEPLHATAPPTASHLFLHIPVAPPKWPSKPGRTPLLDAATGAMLGRTPAELEGRSILAWDNEGVASDVEAVEKATGRWFVPGQRVREGVVEKDTKREDLEGWEEEGKTKLDLYVCTHGQRDCKCSDAGGAVVDALRAEVERRGLGEETVRVWECSHLGGHKWAANLWAFPHNTLLGNILPQHAPLVLDELLPAVAAGSATPSPGALASGPLREFWRGEAGMTKAEMEAIWAQKVTAEVPAATEETGFDVVFKAWDGEECAVRSEPGETIMELGKRLELGAMEGVCGGVLECATCHCFIEPEPSPPPLEEMSDEEDDMLVNAVMRKESSRLGCQIKITKELEEWCAKGGRIGLPRY